MFTDNPTVPAQLEVLLDVVYAMRQRKATPDALRQLVQPKGLRDLTDASKQLSNHLSAAEELGLVAADEDNNIRLTYPVRGRHVPRLAIVAAFDRVALADARAEKWAGRFYAFLIVHEEEPGGAEAVTNGFMQALAPDVDRSNPMNPEKYRALMRWYPYVGLGMIDPAGAFIPDPTERLRRSFPAIWGKAKRLDADEFMERMARACPELDGGLLFDEATAGSYNPSARQCTQAVANSLRRFHEEGVLTLHCPADSRGWSLERAGSGPVPGEFSNRVDSIERTRE